MKISLPLLIVPVLVLGSAIAAQPRSATPTDTPAAAVAAATRADAGADSIARAITILLPQLEAKVGQLAGSVNTQDMAAVLSVARGYQELGLHEQATAWYERLENLEDRDLFADAIFNGRLELAMTEASDAALASVIANYAEHVAEPDATLLARALTGVGRRGSWEEAGRLLEASLALYRDQVPADLLYLQGRVDRRENRLGEAVDHFERQLAAMAEPGAVHPTLLEQRGRFLRGAADCAFLMNDQLRARGLYQRLAVEGDAVEQEWGHFQLAQIDMLASDYAQAEHSFRRIAADSLGTLAELWAASLAEHCAAMSAQRSTLATAGAATSVGLD
jgi:tetratricopeptide (TPR) repeat protein